MKARNVALSSLVACALIFSSSCGGPDIGVTSDEILIGTWAPMTGPASNLSTIARAMDAYFTYINEEEGGIHERNLRLIIKDDGYDPARTPSVVEELVDGDRVFAILGGNGTANCLAVKDYLTLKLIPWVNPGSGARIWTSPVNAYVFSTFPAYVTEGRILAKYAAEELTAKKFGLLYQDDTFGREGQEGVRLGLRNTDKEIVVSEPYQVGAEDLSGVAQKFKDAEVDLIFVWTIAEGAAALVKALDAIEGYQPQIVASQILSDPVMFELAGPSWEGAIVASSVPEPGSNEPGVARAREIIQKYGQGIQFGTYAMWGLSRAEVLVEGLRRAGPDLTRLKLIQSLESIHDWSDNFLGTPISFDTENHQGLNTVQLSKAEGGTLVSLSDWLES
ncbi:MAG TPA: ABC transporter substrate-binding protein [Vicinamibacteria bacterium]|nr:ABC transporter substrate-binding protein [Vicinamibacteria bacterium]